MKAKTKAPVTVTLPIKYWLRLQALLAIAEDLRSSDGGSPTAVQKSVIRTSRKAFNRAFNSANARRLETLSNKEGSANT